MKCSGLCTIGNGLWNTFILWFCGHVEQDSVTVYYWNEIKLDLSCFGSIWFMDLVVWCENMIVNMA